MSTKDHAIQVSGRQIDALPRIIRALRSETDSLTWALFHLEGITNGEVLGRGVLHLEHIVEQSEHGFTVGWEELAAIANGFSDIWSLLLLGTSETLPMRTGKDRTELMDSVECAVERFDSGDWRIHCRDEARCRRIAAVLDTDGRSA
jgi:hypothetical protein